MKFFNLLALVATLALSPLAAADYSSKGGTVELSQSNFNEAVLQSQKPVVVVFSAVWCQPCQLLKPVVNELAKKLGDSAFFAKVDYDQNHELADRYSVKVLPTILFFKNGVLKSTSTGNMNASELESRIKSL